MCRRELHLAAALSLRKHKPLSQLQKNKCIGLLFAAALGLQETLVFWTRSDAEIVALLVALFAEIIAAVVAPFAVVVVRLLAVAQRRGGGGRGREGWG
jgi:hypothetical protein